MDNENSTHNFEFTGNASDYFGIWIVNMLLSIVTFGIYSPWAKVRNNKYLYGSTVVNDSNFEYTANPIRILIGRVIVIGSYIFYIVLADFMGYVIFAQIFLLAFLLLSPWLIRQAVIFRMRYTRYRGVHFMHSATVWQYYKFFIIHIILNIVTIGLVAPYTYKEFKSLILNNTSYGNKNFLFNGKTSSFYILFLKNIILVAVMFGFIFYMGSEYFSSISSLAKASKPEDISRNSIEGILVFLFIAYASFIIFGSLIKGLLEAWLGNIIYNNLSLDDFSFSSDWEALKLAWINLSNFILILFTLGLLYPYAKIRLIRHKVSHTYLSGDNFDGFINTCNEESRSLGEETADFFDFDIGI